MSKESEPKIVIQFAGEPIPHEDGGTVPGMDLLLTNTTPEKAVAMIQIAEALEVMAVAEGVRRQKTARKKATASFTKWHTSWIPKPKIYH